MTTLALIGTDLAAITLLIVVYFHRHRRRDLIVAFLGVNVGVLAVSMVLGTIETTIGLGLGLFGVLSIIRLRSAEISQREVAYYFASLALGLVAGISISVPLAAALMAMIVLALWIGDHPALLRASRRQTVTLDRAITDEADLRNELTGLLRAPIDRAVVQQLDLVRDLTVVDVRYHVKQPKATTGVTADKSADRFERMDA